MRVQRKRIFKITVNGKSQWTEPAGDRTPWEVQHDMAQQADVRSVRVQEQYLGGAHKPHTEDDEDEEETEVSNKPLTLVSGGRR